MFTAYMYFWPIDEHVVHYVDNVDVTEFLVVSEECSYFTYGTYNHFLNLPSKRK